MHAEMATAAATSSLAEVLEPMDAGGGPGGRSEDEESYDTSSPPCSLSVVPVASTVLDKLRAIISAFHN